MTLQEYIFKKTGIRLSDCTKKAEPVGQEAELDGPDIQLVKKMLEMRGPVDHRSFI